MGQRKGYKQTEEHKRKRLESQKRFFENNPDCRKGKKHPLYGKKHSEETKHKISLAHTGKKRSKEFCEQMRQLHLGRKHTEESKRKIGDAQIGKKNHNWKKGASRKYDSACKSSEYVRWRRTILIRDEFTCRLCNQKHMKLEVHHMLPWRNFPILKYMDN